MNADAGRFLELSPRRVAWAISVALAALPVGCGGENYRVGTSYPVKGKVALPDGKPLPAVSVVFSGPVTGRATTEGDGTFAFKGDNAGLPEGDYKVHLEATESKGAGKKAALPFPGKYNDEDTSDLTAKVTAAGPNEFDFKLTQGGPAIDKSPGATRGRARGRD